VVNRSRDVGTAADQIAPGERRELRSIVKGQFKVLRAEVKRRAEEMRAEIEAALAERYRDETADIAEAQREVQRIVLDAARQVEQVGDALRAKHPDLEVRAGMGRFGAITLDAVNGNRAQVHRAMTAAIPHKIGDANLALDRQEVELLRELSVGALDSEQAQRFLGSIPTVGQLVPRARLDEIESGLNGASR
jgi:hypothetical protein